MTSSPCRTDTPDSPYPGDTYSSPKSNCTALGRLFPNMVFYWQMFATLQQASFAAKRGDFGDAGWVASSIRIRRAMEQVGVHIRVEGMNMFKTLQGPCVFIGNHMSTLETFLLPGLIQPYCPIAFVVKESLLNYPFFCHVMRSRNPIAVARKDPRADFSTVMEEGCKRLEQGISVVLFPQSTRSLVLDPKVFNSLGVKLARRAGVPVVPLAMRTDAWGMNGLLGLLKDHGPIRPELPVHFRFGSPLEIVGNGKETHQQVYTFIHNCLREWGLDPLPLLPAGASDDSSGEAPPPQAPPPGG